MTTTTSFRGDSMGLGAVVRPSTKPDLDPPTIESLDFHREGRFLVSADSAAEVILVDALEGKVRKRIRCEAYPIGIVRFTHHDQTVLCTSRGCSSGGAAAHDVRYLSLYDNTYLRFFHGHTDEVVSMAVCPSDDHFVTGSKDR